MKYIYNIKRRMVFLAMLGTACLASAPSIASEPAWWTQQKRDCGLPSSLAYNNWDGKCNSSNGDSISTPSYDYEAVRRAKEVEAELQRQKEAADRIERERQVEIKRQKDAEFVRDRDAAAGTLKGPSGPAVDQLKGLSGPDSSGLKGSGFDNTGLKELRGSDNADQKTVSQPTPHTGTSVVDARNVPTGLAKALENAIASAYADAPPGVSDRVRKGFQAVMDRDWKVAKAWFQDALKRDPSNAGLKRLVALADISQPFGKNSATVDERNEPAGIGGKSEMKGLSAPPNNTKSTSAAETQLQLPGPDDMYLPFGTDLPAADPNLQLPDPNDIYYLFPGLKAIEDKLKTKEAPVFKTLPDGRILQLPTDSDIELLFDLYPDPPAKKSGKAK
ncbi:hypothetical protein BAC1_00635 [uncultured bacterium]|nr:hypothetical protein BAC1_00635 [uncultured bacterium]